MRSLTLITCLAVGVSAIETSSSLAQSRAAAPRPRLSRQDVDRLVSQARQAMRDGDLEEAETLAARAENSGVGYPLLFFGDTPAKLRRDLSRLRAKQPRATASGTVSRPAAPPAAAGAGNDPFQERPAALPSGPSSKPFPPQNPALAPPSADTTPLPSMRQGPVPSNPFAKDEIPRTLPAIGDTRPPSRPPLGMSPEVSQAFEGLGVPSGSAVVPAVAAPPVEQAPPARYPVTNSDAAELLGAPRTAQPARYELIPPDPTAAPENPTSPAVAPPNTNPSAPPATLQLAQTDSPLLEPGSPPMETGSPSLETNSPLSERVEPLVPDAENIESSVITKNIEPSEINQAAQLLQQGEQALRDRDRAAARSLFEQASQMQDQLDPASRQRLQGHLQMLEVAAEESLAPSAIPPQPLSETTPLSEAAPPTEDDSGSLLSLDSEQQVLARQLSAEVGRQQSEARRIREQDPKQALEILQLVRQQVEESQTTEEIRRQLLARVDVTLSETQRYIEDNKAQIELDEENAAVLAEVDRRRAVEVKVQEQVAELVDRFNKLRDEHRYEEMEIVARRLYEIAPEEQIAQQVWENAKFIRRTIINNELMDRKETANWNAWNDVYQASVSNVGEGNEMVFDAVKWQDLQDRTKLTERNSRHTERELEIERKLRSPVMLKFTDAPLSEVVDYLSQVSGINIYIDPRGLSQEGISTDSPITINLNGEISLKSALNLILGPLHLGYLIKDEVLKITSEQLRNGDIYRDVYYVADLVMPIPNFVPSNNLGLQGMLNDAYAAMGYGGGGLGVPGPIALVNSERGLRGPDGLPNQAIMAQQMSGATGPITGGSPRMGLPMATGPGGLGGGAQADFDSLIDLIISTVASDTWAENGGGEAEIRPFPTNLSLVISQTQSVHEEIADLLEQLRRLQDLQVTIEVRFIRLSDSFFERIGIDFNMNIEDRSNIDVPPGLPPGTAYESSTSAVVGLDQPTGLADFPRFTADLDIPFRQRHFGVTAPALAGGFSQDAVSSFGFAILSDIEAYFLVQAAQADNRSNTLEAPKVTLFNGQQAFVSDTSQTPFVISVIPVVGEFAAAQQPVIVVLSEGTMMTIQAVVSDDRRYVRLTVVPFFSLIGDVQEFMFEGSTSTSSSSSTTDIGAEVNGVDVGAGNSEEEAEEQTRSGTTVQLPEFSFVSVTTTVSVPDGGTVLLGGIKRLREERREAGVPLLSKVPYVNRLFKNVGIGRDTDSLMMMVTPRIIIQEEEEERLGVTPPGQ